MSTGNREIPVREFEVSMRVENSVLPADFAAFSTSHRSALNLSSRKDTKFFFLSLPPPFVNPALPLSLACSKRKISGIFVCIAKSNRSTPTLPWHPGLLKNDRYDNSVTEVGIIIAITGQGPTPPEGSMFRYRREATQPTREARTRLLIRRILIHVLVMSPCKLTI
ncbi:hypothetical protein AVEN_236643-1 [Araneus ventricosus]|uniref:Uncharacterized protein n=1 Tax=Araneus ventricosus TaxID=182803 RepID=A0A4Y2KVN6_ARAVE|nr:hypothetical protein AVEN_236643-1 [Araneus ventricosus]